MHAMAFILFHSWFAVACSAFAWALRCRAAALSPRRRCCDLRSRIVADRFPLVLPAQLLAREVAEAYKEGMAAARSIMKDLRQMF